MTRVTDEMVEAAWSHKPEVGQHIGFYYSRHGVRSMLDAALAVAPPANDEGWRPIETAPKDGTDVILFVPKRRVCKSVIAGWFDDKVESGWYSDVAPFDEDVGAPTHWRPLPPPPEES